MQVPVRSLVEVEPDLDGLVPLLDFFWQAVELRLRARFGNHGFKIEDRSPDLYWAAVGPVGTNYDLSRDAVRPSPGLLTSEAAGSRGWVAAALSEFSSGLAFAEDVCLSSESEMRQLQLSNSLVFLERIWPQQQAILIRLAPVVVSIRAHRLRSATSTSAFGAVFLEESAFNSQILLLDLLVHEATHLELLLRNYFFQPLQNPEEYGPSPFRTEPRPLDAVLHAVFVLARLLMLHSRWPPSVRVGSAVVDDYRAKFAEGLSGLERHARCTDLGEVLLDELASVRSQYC